MCTVSFLPTKDGFILTSNRDEQSTRAKAIFPSRKPSLSGELLYPKDGQASGTWICVAPKKMICLLNGAFEKHTPKPPYRQSRGKVVLDAFDALSFQDFRLKYSLENIEPFTLLMIEFTHPLSLVEMKWDGKNKHIKHLNAQQPNLWSSATLYTDNIIKKREAIFHEWCAENEFTIDTIKKLHLSSGIGDMRYDFLMKRENFLETISISSVELKNDEITFLYEDLLTKDPINVPMYLSNA